MRSRNLRSSRNDGCGNLDYSCILSFLRVPGVRASQRDSSPREYVCDQRAITALGVIISGPYIRAEETQASSAWVCMLQIMVPTLDRPACSCRMRTPDPSNHIPEVHDFIQNLPNVWNNMVNH